MYGWEIVWLKPIGSAVRLGIFILVASYPYDWWVAPELNKLFNTTSTCTFTPADMKPIYPGQRFEYDSKTCQFKMLGPTPPTPKL